MINFYSIILKIPAALIALTVSSFSRHLMAYMLGDDTPRRYGKLTLMPTAHLDPVGFLMMLIFRFGWSRPPAVNTNNFKRNKISLLLFFISSPLGNLITAVLANLILSIISVYLNPIKEIKDILVTTIHFNISLAAISFIPIPPFTGYYIIKEFLPYELKYKISSIEKYSFLILIVLIYTNILGIIIQPIYLLFFKIILFFGGLIY